MYEEVIEAHKEVRERAIEHFVKEGHPRRSAEVIVSYMTYKQQAELVGQETGRPYSPY